MFVSQGRLKGDTMIEVTDFAHRSSIILDDKLYQTESYTCVSTVYSELQQVEDDLTWELILLRIGMWIEQLLLLRHNKHSVCMQSGHSGSNLHGNSGY